LTFQPAAANPAQNDDTKAGYQGVFFKWGSLVGISTTQAFSGTSDIYVPIVKESLSTSTWKATKGNAMQYDNTFPTVTSNWTSWGDNITNYPTDLPYMDPSRGGSSTDRGNTWAIDANVYDVYKGFRGDICQYIGATTSDSNLKGYRLPTSYEFGLGGYFGWTGGGTSSDSWIKGSNSFPAATGNAEGTTNITGTPPTKSYAKNTSMDNVIFPASGYLRGDVEVDLVGTQAYYWSGSSNGTLSSWFMSFSIDFVRPANALTRNYGFSVRCVKKLDPNGSY
jgi:hypothetical protein